MCQILNVFVCDNLQTSEILLLKFDNGEFVFVCDNLQNTFNEI